MRRCGTTLSYRRLALEHATSPTRGCDTPRVDAPKTRSECVDGPRPCPFVGCRHHLFLDIKHNGSIKFPHGADPQSTRLPAPEGPDNADRLRAIPETCALDVADRGSHELTQLAQILGGISRERVRQEVEEALRKLRHACRRMGMTRELFEGD